MFYYGTEVIVVGSNVKRKSGPRIGSTGRILHEIKNKNNFVSETQATYTTILFDRFGYEKKRRAETIRVMSHTPSAVTLSHTKLNVKTCLNKLISTTKSSKHISSNPNIVVLAPVNVFYDIYRTYKVKDNNNYSKLVQFIATNLQVRSVCRIIDAIVTHQIPEYSMLSRTLSFELYKELRTLTQLNLKDKQKYLITLLKKNLNIIKELVKFINTLKALEIRQLELFAKINAIPIHNKYLILETLLQHMFSDNVYNCVKTVADLKGINTTTISSFKKELVNKGNNTYKAY